MARTQLARQLQRVASAFRAADATGVPADEVFAGALSGSPGLGRRDFLKGAAAVAGAGAIMSTSAPRARAVSAPRLQPRIAIVGAGIAGMTAAMTLTDYGFTKVSVFEANPDRVGGRVWTNRSGFWNNGQITEWGGELIDSNHKTVFALAQRFGIKVFDTQQNQTDDIYFFDGAYYPVSDVLADFKAVNAAITRDMQSFTWPVAYNVQNTAAGIALSNMTLFDWIETRVPGGHASRMGQLLDVAYNTEYGEETTGQTALGLLGLLGYKASPGNFAMFGISDERWKLIGGNDQLITGQIGVVGADRINLGHSLESVIRNADGTLTLNFVVAGAAKTVTADKVILALPVSILRGIEAAGGFARAGFSPLMTGVFRNYGMGANGKVQLQFTDRLWNQSGPWGGPSNGESFSDQGCQLVWESTRGQAGATGILVAYSGGALARSQTASSPFATTASAGTLGKTVTSLAKQFLSQYEPILPGITSRWNGKATASLWHQNPYSLGAYSYWKPGYCQTYSGYESVAQGNVHFAGEYISNDFQGYIEGGATEGVRAANEVYAYAK